MPKNRMWVIALVSLAVLVFIAGALFYRRSYFQGSLSSDTQKQTEIEGSDQVSESTAISMQNLSVNYSETGTVSDWDTNRETHTNNWTFLYEKPGKPALNLKLEFNQKSVCDVGKGDKSCNPKEFTSGSKAKIEGNRSNGKVTVSHLTMIAVVP